MLQGEPVAAMGARTAVAARVARMGVVMGVAVWAAAREAAGSVMVNMVAGVEEEALRVAWQGQATRAAEARVAASMAAAMRGVGSPVAVVRAQRPGEP